MRWQRTTSPKMFSFILQCEFPLTLSLPFCDPGHTRCLFPAALCQGTGVLSEDEQSRSAHHIVLVLGFIPSCSLVSACGLSCVVIAVERVLCCQAALLPGLWHWGACHSSFSIDTSRLPPGEVPSWAQRCSLCPPRHGFSAATGTRRRALHHHPRSR